MIENLTLAIRGKCEIKEAFNEAQKNVKQFGQDNKDAAEAGKKAFEEMSNVVGGQLTSSLGGAFSVVAEMAKGGIWAAMAEVVKTAVSVIGEKLKEMKQHAVDVAKAISEGITGSVERATQKFTEMAAAADSAMKSATAAASNKNSIIDSKAEYEIQQLRYEAYQKCLNEATEEGRKLIEAEMNMRISYVELNAQTDKAKNQVEAQTAIVAETAKKRESAENAVNAALNAQADVNNQLNVAGAEKKALIEQYMALQAQQNVSVEALTEQGMQYVEALKFKKESADQLVTFEKDNADLLEQYGDLIRAKQESAKRVAEADARLEAVKLDEEKASVDLANAKRNLETVTSVHKMETEKASAAISDLEASFRVNAQAELNAAAVQNELTQKKIRDAEAIENAEGKLYGATVAAADWLSTENEVTDLFVKNKIKRADAEKALIEILQTASSAEEVYIEAKKAVAELLEKRKKQEEQELLWDEKRFDEKKKGKLDEETKASASASITVRVPDLQKTAEDSFRNFREYEREQRDKQLTAARQKEIMRQNMEPMSKYLTGDMSKDRAAAFANYFTTLENPLEAIKTAFEASQASRLTNETERKNERRKVLQLIELVQKSMGLK